MKNVDCAVAVVGAGPAGVATAFTLGKSNVPTLLIDKKDKNEIGDKVCGDALDSVYYDQANRMVGLPKPKNDGNEIKEICERSIFYGKTTENYIDLTSSSVTVDRLKYGQSLLKSATEFPSVSLLANTSIKDVIVGNDNQLTGLLVVQRKKNKLEEIQINTILTIDCSGSSSGVRSRLPSQMCTKFPNRLPRNQMVVAYREIIRLSQEHKYRRGLYLTYEPEIKMPGYYWIFSRGARELNIGLGWLQTEQNRKGQIKNVHDKIRDRKFPDAKILKSDGDQIPARLPLPSLVHNGFMTAGDAGALANPINGEGHGPALVSGVKAAEIAIIALENNDVSEKGLWAYNKWIWNRFGPEFSYGIPAVKFINKYGFDAFDWILRKGVLKSNDITLMIRDPNASLGILNRVARGIARPRLLNGLRLLFKQAQEIQELSRSYPEYEAFDEWNKKLQKIETQSI